MVGPPGAALIALDGRLKAAAERPVRVNGDTC